MLLTFDCLSAQAINQRGKREDPSLTVDREGDVSKIVIISLLSVSDGFGNDFDSRETVSDARRKKIKRYAKFTLTSVEL